MALSLTLHNLLITVVSRSDEVAKWGYSWHHWAYKLYGAWTWDSHGLFSLGDDNNYSCPTLESCLNTDSVRTYARTYPAAVAGTADYFHFDPDTSEAVLCHITYLLELPMKFHNIQRTLLSSVS